MGADEDEDENTKFQAKLNSKVLIRDGFTAAGALQAPSLTALVQQDDYAAAT